MPGLALDDADDVVAHHEAGHAVASYRLRGFVGTVTIEPNARHAGGTEVWVLSPPLVDHDGKVVEKPEYTPDEIKCFEDATMIAIAGPVSETLYWRQRDYDAVVAANSDDEGKIVTITKKIWGASARDMEILSVTASGRSLRSTGRTFKGSPRLWKRRGCSIEPPSSVLSRVAMPHRVAARGLPSPDLPDFGPRLLFSATRPR